MAQYLTPKVVEIPRHLHRVTPDEFIEANLELGMYGQVIEVNFRPEPLEDLSA